MNIGIIFGTRPEAIKIAPIYYYLKEQGENVILIGTGQHETMLRESLESFKIDLQINLKLQRNDNSLEELTYTLLKEIGGELKKLKLDLILVQGDTTSAFVGALLGFYSKIPVGHIEAGLRTDNIYAPFPEEVNRRLIGQIATYHLAPTEKAVKNLLESGIKKENIALVGNTVIDALILNQKINKEKIEYIEKENNLKIKKYILMTMHRRESIPNGVITVLKGAKKFLEKYQDIELIYPVHKNEKLRELTMMNKEKWGGIKFIEPLNYIEISAYLKNAIFVMTDSGGIQEEAPSYNKYTLILRDETERQEIVESGIGILAGVETEKIFKEMDKLYKIVLEEKEEIKLINPYGNGTSSIKIYDFIKDKMMNYEE